MVIGLVVQKLIKFEKNISKICNTKYCVSLNSGTDALTLALAFIRCEKVMKLLLHQILLLHQLL